MTELGIERAVSDPSADSVPAQSATFARDLPSSSRPEPIMLRGSGRMVGRVESTHATVRTHADTVNLEFADAPLAEVVQALLGDLLGLGLSVEYMPDAVVSLRTGAPVPRESVFAIVESMLNTHGARIVDSSSGVYRITSADRVRLQPLPLRSRGSVQQGQSLMVVPLRYVGAVEMGNILSPIVPAESLVRVDSGRNLLILAGSSDQHEAWADIISSFDVDYLDGMSIGIFPLEYASIEDVTDVLKAMIRGAGKDESSPHVGALQWFPITRLNSVVAVSHRPEALDRVKRWIDALDQPAINELEPRLYVYPVQNGAASQLATLLGSLYGGAEAMGPAAGRAVADSGVAPGLRETAINSTAGETAALPEAETPLSALTSSVGLGDQVRVVADEQSNALLILAPRRDFRKIEAALRQLDRAPTQILIEANIIEVSLADDLRFGLEWTFRGGLGDGRTGTGLLNLNQSGAIRPSQPGFSYTVRGAGGEIQAVLNALAQDSRLRVLSNPSVLVQDNHTASIHVGDQQPVQTSTTLTEGGNEKTTIEYRDTGVMLSVTPSVNAGGLVSMNLHQTVTDVGAIDEATGQRSFLQRQIRSRVSVRSGETVVMGGLIRERNSASRSGLPGLRDVPLLGHLFGTSSSEAKRTELLVLITPRVLADESDLRAMGNEVRSRMRGLAGSGFVRDGSERLR